MSYNFQRKKPLFSAFDTSLYWTGRPVFVFRLLIWFHESCLFQYFPLFWILLVARITGSTSEKGSAGRRQAWVPWSELGEVRGNRGHLESMLLYVATGLEIDNFIESQFSACAFIFYMDSFMYFILFTPTAIIQFPFESQETEFKWTSVKNQS